MDDNHDPPIASSSSSPSAPFALSPSDLLQADPTTLALPLLHLSLAPLDLPTVLATCANLILSARLTHPDVVRGIIKLGLTRGEGEVSLLEDSVRGSLGLSPDSEWQGDVGPAIEQWVGADERRGNILRCLAVLREAQHRLETYETIAPRPDPLPSSAGLGGDEMEVEIEDDPWAEAEDETGAGADAAAMDLDDPWAEASTNEVDPEQDPPTEAPPEVEPLVPLPLFLIQPIVLSTLSIAASAHLTSLRKICERHSAELAPYRLALLDALPGWVVPADPDLVVLLPGLDEDGTERPWPRKRTPTGKTSIIDLVPVAFRLQITTHVPSLNAPLSAASLSKWYSDRVLSLDELGLLDAQLAWVQHGAALGVPSLDALGEDLSLLSRLVYDAHLSSSQLDKWSIWTWRAASETDIVRAYTSSSTPQTVVGDIRQLVLPYLYVLESRAERTGKADPGIIERMMYDAILDLPLTLALPCFEASKATEPQHTRLIKNDQDVARLALACLYGSDQLNVWSTMSAIFECLPVWDVSGGDLESDQEATSTTLDSIATFVRPTVSDPLPTSKDLFLFFHPLPFASLSRALDILDVHLESGELLARWETPVRLQLLLQTARDKDGQVTLVERMVRRQSSRGGDERRWTALWDDMRKLNGGNDSLLRGAFGVLSLEELMRIYLGGLVGSGNFPIATKMIRRLEQEDYFTPQMLQEVVLDKSREFYERAETANIHTGDMKLAYDCLSIAPASPAIKAEKELIEATSRLTTFRSLSSLTPAEIRHSSNRLDLIRRVLSTSDDAFRHGEIILSLADGLGYRSDPAARAEVVGMLADAAIEAGEWTVAADKCAELVDMARGAGRVGGEKAKWRIEDVTWKTCLALGRRDEWNDPKRRMEVLAFSLAFCPPDSVKTVLPLWRKAEDLSLTAGSHETSATSTGSTTSPRSPSLSRDGRSRLGAGAASSPTREERVLGSRTAARAAQLARDLSSSFKLRPASGTAGVGAGEGWGEGWGEQHDTAPGSAGDLFHGVNEAERVGEHARRALVKGVGWLLGADEREIVG